VAKQDHQFLFKPLTESDLQLLCEWLNQPHLQKWWRKGNISLDMVREKYLPRISGADTAKPFVALLNERPVGDIQYYLMAEDDQEWWPGADDGINQDY